jgi:arylsulfatase A-like enzyme
VFDDQLRADVCGVYGGRNITTPNIDRLAREGVTFTNSVSSCPLCTPYRGMLQTGRHPTHSGILFNFVEASHAQNPHCIADVFGAAGYQTGFIGKWHLAAGAHNTDDVFGSDPEAVTNYVAQNPEPEHVPPGQTRLGYGHWQAYNFLTNFYGYYCYEDTPDRIYSDQYETDAQTGQAIAYMEKCRQAGLPFFVCVAPHPPHPPFGESSTPSGYLDQVPQALWWAPNVPADNPRTLLEMRCYLAMAKNMDDNLGRLLDYLENSGLAEDTIVVFTSDHGEMHGSHGRLNKMVPYAEAIDIPMIIRWPKRIAAGGRIDTLHTPIDHLPTLCGLAGLPIPPEVDGADLSGILLGQAQDTRDAVLIANYTSNWDFLQTGTSWPEWRGVKTKQYTYCLWLTGGEELYDNLTDPFQMTNLVADGTQAPALEQLRARMWQLLAEAHDDFRPGTSYAEWFDGQRRLVATGLGPVPS